MKDITTTPTAELLAEKDAEIARLKAEIEAANFAAIHAQQIALSKMDEAHLLKAENQRLRDGIKRVVDANSSHPWAGIDREDLIEDVHQMNSVLQTLLSPAPEKPEEKPVPEMIDERPIIYRYKPDMAALGLSEQQAMHHDMAEEYAVVDCDLANAGIVVYAKWRGKWEANPWATRFLVRHLIESLGIKINPIKAR